MTSKIESLPAEPKGVEIEVAETFTAPVGWLTIDHLKLIASEHPELTEQDIIQIAEEASWVLTQLTDGRFHGITCWADEYELVGCKVRIQRSPLRAIEKVQQIHDVCGARNREDLDWCLVGPGTISVCGCQNELDFRTNFGAGCGCPKRVRIEYSLKDNIPPGGRNAVLNLASEYAKAKSGKKCALPERVTSVSRQGISWTILDPQDFMDKGLLGLGRIDHWLNVAKRSKGGRARDPLLGRRITTVRLSDGPCGDPFTPGFSKGFDTP